MKEHLSSHRRTSYEVNGVKYTRFEDVPKEFRHLFADANDNGIPDFAQSAQHAVRSAINSEFQSHTTSSETPRELRTPLGQLPVDAPSSAEEQLSTIRCAQCGYDLTGSSIGAQCPECGHAVLSSIHSVVRRQPSRPWCLFNAFWQATVILIVILFVVATSLIVAHVLRAVI